MSQAIFIWYCMNASLYDVWIDLFIFQIVWLDDALSSFVISHNSLLIKLHLFLFLCFLYILFICEIKKFPMFSTLMYFEI